MKYKTKLIYLLSIISVLLVFSNVSATIDDGCNPSGGVDTTEFYYEFNSSDLYKFEFSDDDKYFIQGEWPNADYDENIYLLWEDFCTDLPECIDIHNVTLNFEWTKVGCMNIREARIFIKTDSQDWIQVWEKTLNLPESDVIEVIDLTPYISDADDLDSLQVKFQAWANLFGHSEHDWVELNVDYEECLTHTECSQGYCMEVYGEGEDQCITDSDCRHNICNDNDMTCDEIFEVGQNECITYDDCPQHSVCDHQQKICTLVGGEGVDECDTYDDCLHYICDYDTFTCENRPITEEGDDCLETTEDSTGKTPDEARLHDGTIVTSKVEYSDDVYATQQVPDSPRYIYLDWQFGGISYDATIDYAELSLEHKEASVLISVQWHDGSEYIDVCDPPERTTDTVDTCDLSPYIDTVSEAEDVDIRLKLVKTGTCHEDLDWAYLEIGYSSEEFLECFEMKCDYEQYECTQAIPGTPGIFCETFDDCPQHTECNYNLQQCELVEGAGEDECDTYSDCIHTECNYIGFTCDTINAPGGDECLTFDDCLYCGDGIITPPEECEDDSDCPCPEDGCVGSNWYEYPEHGDCVECMCDVDETPCQGPCKPSIIVNDPRCTHYVCDYDQQACALVEGEDEDECLTFDDCPQHTECNYDLEQCVILKGEGVDECDTFDDCLQDICNYDTLTCETVPGGQPGDACSVDSDCYHTECNYDLEQCVDVPYDGIDQCQTFLPDCGECIEDSDCDNGLWCDGPEACIDNQCQPSTAPCVYWVDECTEVSCDEEIDQCVETQIPGCCIDDDDCDYLDDNYCNCYTGNFRMRDDGVCEDNECITETTILENCDVYDSWYYDGWETFTCYRSRDKEYREYGCYEDNDETYCDYEVTDTDSETENINEGMVCDLGEETCKDTCTIGQEQYTCQSGECAFDIWTNLVDTDPFSCIDGEPNGCSEQCGAECEDKFDCDCEEDKCVGSDWYDYPEQGLCEADCTCNVDDTPCEGPCAPNIYEDHPNCYTCVDNDEDGYFAIDSNCPEGDDCDDEDDQVYPGAKEWCCDGIDNDCDGDVDCEDDDCWPSCDDSDDDDVPDYDDECIGENQANLPEDTLCRDWFFNGENGCHDYTNDDGSTVCETTEESYYTCMEGDVYYVYATTTTYCGVDTGYCDGAGTAASGIALHEECEENRVCVEGDDYCHYYTDNHDQPFEPTPNGNGDKKTTSKKLGDGPSKGQSDFNIFCGDGFCVIPQEIEDGLYYCPTDCGLMSWYQFN